MKEEKTKKRKFLYYLVLAISVCLLTAATVLTVYFVTDNGANTLDSNPTDVKPVEPDKPTVDDKPTITTTDDFIVPVTYANATVYNDIYRSKTTGYIYRHKGVDFAADEGAKVTAIADGTIEKISLNDKIGNLIVVNHGGGLKGYYKFVEPIASLKQGAKITKGQSFATVAAAYGSEAKDGTHLHLELVLDGKPADPAYYLNIRYPEK